MPPKQVQLRYIREIVMLMLWFMYRLVSEKNIPFSVALTDYVDIYRKTAFFNLADDSDTQRLRPQWDECSARLGKSFASHISVGSPATQVEEEGLQLLWPHLVERIDRGLPLVEYRRDAMFGCFYYHVTKSVADLHFTNTIMPEAPLSDLAGRTRELYRLVLHCRQEHPETAQIKCGTWMNQYPPFRRLFPLSWKDSGERKSYNSLGWWGQFVNHEGDIQGHNVAQFRATGNFPYQCTFHRCETKILEDYLSQIVKRLSPDQTLPG